MACIRSLQPDSNSKPSDIENKVTVSSIARRRLAVVCARLRMSETVSDVSTALTFGSISAKRKGRPHDRAGSCASWHYTNHRPGHADHTTYGGLCYLGRHQREEEDHHEVQRRGGLPA